MSDATGNEYRINVDVVGVDATMVPELRGSRGYREMAKMAATDDTIGAMLWAMETTLAQIDWNHEPRDNGEPSQAPQAVAAATFANSLLHDMSHSFKDHVEEAVSMVVFGFSISEIQTKRRDGVGSRYNDGYWGLKRLAHCDQAATLTWEVRDGDVVAYQQMTSAGTKTIPLSKALHYTIRGSADRPAGRTLFSNIHRSWFLKNNIQDSEAIGIRRELAGLPRARVPKSDMDLAIKAKKAGDAATPEQKAAAARIQAMLIAATKMRLNETAGMVLPSDPFVDGDGKPTSIRQYDFDIMTGAGQRTVDTNSAIGRYDRAIARAAMMQFLHLGDRSTGSYNLSENQSSMALKSLLMLVGKIRTEWKKAIRMIWVMNGMDLRWMPELVNSPLTEDDLTSIGTFLDKLASSIDLLNQEPELKAAMFKRLGVKANPDVKAQLPQDRPEPAEPLDPVDA